MGGERGPHNRKSSSSSNSNGEIFEEKDENGTAASETRTRIFVGGLGGSVTADDLRNTFSSLGKVESVEIVRTQGRGFAYLDFLPSSSKSLSKLFSTYNGCKWKGGRLRLEKAKQHYLLRLRQEWEEDAKSAESEPCSAAAKNMGSPEKINNVLNPEKMELRLFFPKLRKVKALPFKGTGKHKYSFQRVEVPPLPIHFCDCEEHSNPSHTAKQKNFLDLETQGGGIDEKELEMMNSVMNKLFERKCASKPERGGAGLVKEGGNAAKSVDDLLVEENETDHMTDEDNLVTNMVAGGKRKTALSGSWRQEAVLEKDRERVSKAASGEAGLVKEGGSVTKLVDDLLIDESETDHMTDEDNLVTNMVTGGKRKAASSGSWGHEAILANEEAIVDELRNTSKDKPSRNVLASSQRRKIVASGKKRESPLTEEPQENGVASVNHSQSKGSTKKAHLHELGQAIELESGTQQTNTNLSGSQKSRWRDLAGERSNNSFSISHITQSTTPDREESNSNGGNVTCVTECQNQNLVKFTLESQAGCLAEPKQLAVTQPNKSDEALIKYARGASWLQKSSWTQLVSERHTSFSISQLLPGRTFGKEEQVEPKSIYAADLTVTKQSNLVKSGSSLVSEDGSKASGVGNKDILPAPDSSNVVALATVLDPELSPQKDPQTFGETHENTAPKEKHAAAEQPSVRKIGEACSFMRSAASMKEWKNAKAALSGSLKKKNNVK